MVRYEVWVKKFNENPLDRKYRWIIYSRDGFHCQRCDELGEIYFSWNALCCDLVVHHINGDRNNHSLENLISLCAGCHLEVHDGDWRNEPVEFFSPRTVSKKFIVDAVHDHNLRVFNQRRKQLEEDRCLFREREEHRKRMLTVKMEDLE